MNKIVAAIAAIATIGGVSAASAADVSRPAPVSYSAPSFGSNHLTSGTRAGTSMGRTSSLDGGDTIIVAAAAGVAGYFLYDVIHDNNSSKSP